MTITMPSSTGNHNLLRTLLPLHSQDCRTHSPPNRKNSNCLPDLDFEYWSPSLVAQEKAYRRRNAVHAFFSIPLY
jgi:hypothetical protein